MESQTFLSDAAVLNPEPRQQNRKTFMLKVALLFTNLALACVVAAFVVRESGRSESLFANFDTNGDGKLDLKTELIGRLDASDSDKNGAIDAQEWEALKSVHRRAIVMVKMGGDEGGLRFDPSVVTIRAGDMIEFINNRRFPHNIVFDEDAVPAGVDASAISRDDLFNAPGEVYQVMLTVPGTYGYYCEPHQGAGMQGQIIVTL